MNEIQYDRWQRIRQGGKDRFVWRTGVLAWGMSAGTMYAVVMHLMDHDWQAASLLSFSFLSFLAISLLLFALAGFFWGRIVWRLTEKRFLDEQAKRGA